MDCVKIVLDEDKMLADFSSEKLLYLASPYTHVEASVRERRFKAICIAVVRLMKSGHPLVFSPIAHCHHIAIIGDLPSTWSFWGPFCKELVDAADLVGVLQIPGWETSFGISQEVALARTYNLPVIPIPATDEEIRVSLVQ